ncbi:MAG: TlpA disulfide reductase family protein [Gemmatimonadales bacterium]
MMTRQRWTLMAGGAMAAIFAVALTLRVLPEIALIGVGSRAPEFAAVDLRTGRPSGLADYRGRVVLLNIWATWCLPCRVEMPAMERLAHRLADTDFRIVAVSVDEADSTVVNAFAQELGLSFDILHDRTGSIQRFYQTTGVPESFVINREGSIVKKVIGAAAWDSPVNETIIRRLLDER